MRIPIFATFAALAALTFAGAPAGAEGSGGGGSAGAGGMSPSSSAPAYDAAAEYRKGIVALEAKDHKGALAAFKRVLAVVPGDANTNYLAGLASAGTGDDKKAASYFQRAVKANGSLIPAHRELGITRAKLGDKAGATAARAALEKKLATCGETCADAAAIKDAIAAIDAALAGTPQARLELPQGFASAPAGDLAYLDAVALINERRYGEAIASLDAARKAFGPHPDILTYLGFANRKLGRFDVAQGYYRAALRVYPTHRGALEYQGELKVERGDLSGARANLALLDMSCTFGCYEAEELRRWIAAGRAPQG
jgi:tetratricopeptide (TPR) repeat protein